MRPISRDDCDLMFAKARLVLQESYRIANIERPISVFNASRKFDQLEDMLKEKHQKNYDTFLESIGETR